MNLQVYMNVCMYRCTYACTRVSIYADLLLNNALQFVLADLAILLQNSYKERIQRSEVCTSTNTR